MLGIMGMTQLWRRKTKRSIWAVVLLQARGSTRASASATIHQKNVSKPCKLRRGLKNKKNECWFNALLQCLVKTPLEGQVAEDDGPLTPPLLCFDKDVWRDKRHWTERCLSPSSRSWHLCSPWYGEERTARCQRGLRCPHDINRSGFGGQSS